MTEWRSGGVDKASASRDVLSQVFNKQTACTNVSSACVTPRAMASSMLACGVRFLRKAAATLLMRSRGLLEAPRKCYIIVRCKPTASQLLLQIKLVASKLRK